MRALLCLLALVLAPLAHAQRESAERDKGWDPELGELELVIQYEDDAPRGRAAPATVTLRSTSRRTAATRRVGVAFNGNRRSLVPLARSERETFTATGSVPTLQSLRSVTVYLDDQQVLFPIPALEEDEDGNQVGSYSEEGSGFWVVIKVGTNYPPPFIVIVVGDAPDDVVTGDGDGGSGDVEEPGEGEDKGEESGEGSGGEGEQGNNM